MSNDDIVKIPFGDSASDTATLLLAAAEDKELDPNVITTDGHGNFYAPKSVAKKAGVEHESAEEPDVPRNDAPGLDPDVVPPEVAADHMGEEDTVGVTGTPDEPPQDQAEAKKAPARKAPAKKAAKKAPAKKAAANKPAKG